MTHRYLRVSARLFFYYFSMFFLLPALIPAWAASFSADLVETRRGKVKTGKLYVLDHNYRLDIKEKGQTIHVLVDEKKGKTHVLVPSEKVYLEMENTDMRSMMNNPFAAYKHMLQNYEVHAAGSEKIGPVTCDKQVFIIQGKEAMTAWFATGYNFLIRLENNMNGQQVELKNITPGGVTADLFNIPRGFKLVSSMPLPPPDWARDIANAQVMTPPFETLLQEGQIIRIKPVRDFNIKIIGRPTRPKGSFTSTAFKGGRPLKIIAGMPGGSKTHKETPDEADEIVVRAKSGPVKISVKLVEAPEGMVLKTYELKANSGRQFNVDHRKAARLVVSDNKADGKRSRGTLIIFTTITKDAGGGVTAYDKKEVERYELLLANGESKTWHFEQGQQIGSFDITLVEGRVTARVEQPEKPGATPPAWTKTPAAAAAATTSQTGGAPQGPSKAASPAVRATATQGAGRMVLIFDASGSMWGQIDGKPKIAIAKEVMTELVKELPADLHVGLTIYGHRRKGDCKDIEMVMPVRQLDAEEIIAKIRAINPKGKTPISGSLLQVAETLKDQPGEKVVVLITDGLESCDRDPCKVARELMAAGAVTKIHIVGFDLTGEALEKLKCITAPSGGLLVGAQNAAELKAALTEVVAASLPHNLVVRGLDSNGKLLYITVQITRKGSLVSKRSGGNLRFSLPPGQYRIEARYAPLDRAVVLQNVIVEETRLTEKEVTFAESKLKIISLDVNRKPLYSHATVYQAGSDAPIKEDNGSSHIFSLAPGAYDVKVTRSKPKAELWIRNLETRAGGQTVKEVVFAEARLKIKAVDGNNNKVYSSAEVYYSGTSDLLHRKTGSPKFTLMPGLYDVKVTCSAIKADKWLRNIQLKAGDRIEQKVHFAFGKIKVTGLLPDGKKAYLGVRVYKSGSKEQIRRATGGSPSFTLKPGTYDIQVSAGKIKAEKWLRGIRITDGAYIKKQVQF